MMKKVYERDASAEQSPLTPYKKCCNKMKAMLSKLQQTYGDGVIDMSFRSVLKITERCIDDPDSVDAAKMTVNSMVKSLKKEYDLKTIVKAYNAVSKKVLENIEKETSKMKVAEGRLSDMHKASDVSSVANSSAAKAKSSARRVAQYLYSVCEEFCNEVNEDSKIKIHPYLIQDMNNYLVKKNIHWCVGFTDDDSTPIKQLGMTSFNAGWGIQDPTGPQYSVGEASFFEFENYEPIARPGMGGWDTVLSEKLDDDPMSITSEDLWNCLEKDTVFMNWLMTEEYDPDFDEETGEYFDEMTESVESEEDEKECDCKDGEECEKCKDGKCDCKESLSAKYSKLNKKINEGYYNDEVNHPEGGGTCNECGCDVAPGDFYDVDLDSTREIIIEYMVEEFGGDPMRINYGSDAQRWFGYDDDEWDESLSEIYNYMPDNADYLCHDCMHAACKAAVHQWHLDYFDSEIEDEEMFGPMGESKNKPAGKKAVKEAAVVPGGVNVNIENYEIFGGREITPQTHEIVDYICEMLNSDSYTLKVGYGEGSISLTGLSVAQLQDLTEVLYNDVMGPADLSRSRLLVYTR